MKTHVRFRSRSFPPYPGEEDEINPNRYGKRLAEFFAHGLRAEGFDPDDPSVEDWGWIVSLRNEPFDLWIGCGNDEDEEHGFLCFIEPHEASVRKWFRKIPTTARVEALQSAMDRLLLGHPDVQGVRWQTYEEFHDPGGA